ncbi:heterogeneous nuclear ribonucleoprotein 1 [Olea europaea var. sylvestris]|uniref:heterogeneous nuclear ribonucleoprotein 1 n=1 Tax=Olea europaea var. sylvestris TaxID=158386 RepID=UPI000C1D8211|nr:heterogeneous nuclear ribonucleoprotein 1 [Olea europaea var. sylvestris]
MDEQHNASEMNLMVNGEDNGVGRTPERTNFENSYPHTGNGASPGKIFIGGLARETTSAQFVKYFGKYGEITDSVIMKDRMTGHPRGFGFVTYADPSVVDRVIEETHIINGKQVEIKRTIPRGANIKDFRTKKIFVGGIPTTVGEDEFGDFFSKLGEVKELQIMKDHSSGRSRGFGFITFETEQSVDDILANGNRLDFAGAQVEIKKAEPKKPNPPPPPPSKRLSNSRAGFGDTYGGFGGVGGFGAGSYRSGGAYGGRGSGYGGYGGSEIGVYSGYGAGGYGGFRGDPSLEYNSRYAGGYGRGYDLGGEYGRHGESYGGYSGGGYGGYGGVTGFGGGYGGGDSSYGGSLYGNRGYGGGGGSGRYHPYGR